MMVTSEQIRREAARIWPELAFIVLSDPSWAGAVEAELSRILALCAIERPPYIANLWECEEFALDFVAFTRRRRAEAALSGEIPTGRWLNWPLGICCGTRFRGRDIDHWQNIALTSDRGLVLIEPQTGEIWNPEAAADQIYFLLM